MRLLLFNLATDADDPVLGFTTSWIRALAERVDSIHVITMRAGRVEVPDNVQVYSVGKEKGYSEPHRAVEFYRHLLRILSEQRIDACFSHMIPMFTVLAAPVLRPRGVPIVTWYAHPSLSWPLRVAHCFSARTLTSVTTAYPYKHDKLAVVGQGIDVALFAPDGTTPEKPPIILSVGRLSPVKGHRILIRAAASLQRRYAFRVVLVGAAARPQDESYVRSLHELIRTLGLQDVVHCEPAVPMMELPRWYRRCTVHVNLTPTGFGDKVAWEAMSCGRPCLVASEGFRETLGKYAEALLFRYADPEDLAKKLGARLDLSPTKRQHIGTYLRDQVIEMHSLARLSDKLADVFGEVCTCRG